MRPAYPAFEGGYARPTLPRLRAFLRSWSHGWVALTQSFLRCQEVMGLRVL